MFKPRGKNYACLELSGNRCIFYVTWSQRNVPAKHRIRQIEDSKIFCVFLCQVTLVRTVYLEEHMAAMWEFKVAMTLGCVNKRRTSKQNRKQHKQWWEVTFRLLQTSNQWGDTPHCVCVGCVCVRWLMSLGRCPVSGSHKWLLCMQKATCH